MGLMGDATGLKSHKQEKNQKKKKDDKTNGSKRNKSKTIGTK
jgi:hypothetical protein